MVVENKTKNKKQLGRNRGITETQLGFSLDQKVNICWGELNKRCP
jgi:hypothetical protein